MKQTIAIILFALIALTGCKKENSQEQESKLVPATPVADEQLRLIEGEFYYTDEAAVLKGKSFIYGIKRDLMAEELSERTAPKKRNEFDMIPVTIRGVIEPNPEVTADGEGWKEIVVIKEIIKIADPTDEETIKIESGS